MGRSPRRSRFPGLFLFLGLLVAAAAAVIFGVPPGASPEVDRARREVDRILASIPKPAAGAPVPAPVAPRAGTMRTVVRVVDGDTVVLDGSEKVRLVGVNTPESVDPRRPVQWYGKEASDWTRRLLQGRKVRVEHDVEPKDKYGRTLAYLWLEDGTFVNLRLVEDGFAFAYPYPPNVRYESAFRDAERRARAAGRGMWSNRGKADSLIPKSRR